MAAPLRWIREIIAPIYKPISSRHLRTRKQGRQALTCVDGI
jgi:hypothetical protein